MSLSLVDAVAHLLRVERILSRGDSWIYGETFGIDQRRYLVILSSAEDLAHRLGAEVGDGHRKTSRALARAAGAQIPGTVLDGRIHKIFVIKTSPGALRLSASADSEEWQAFHLNDLIAEQVLNLRLEQVSYNTGSLPSPIGELARTDLSGFVAPEIENSGALGGATNAINVLSNWATSSDGPPFLTVFGIGGLGKTTLLRLTGAHLWRGFTNYQHSRLPAFVPMKGIPAGADLDLASHINSFDLFKRRTTAAAVEALIASGLLVVFLDAFDEHLKFANRSDAVRFLRKLRESYATDANSRTARIILTSRDYYLNTDTIFADELGSVSQRFTLRPFNREQRRRFIALSVGHAMSAERIDSWCGALERVVSGLGGADYLVGHSLFLHAFSKYIYGVERGKADITLPVQSPEDFANLQSSQLFDAVIDLINEREAREKSNWGTEIYSRLSEQWHQSPFASNNQRRFFAEIARRILQEKRYYERPPVVDQIGGVGIERQTRQALADTIGWPQAMPGLDPKVRDQVEKEALDSIAHFFRQHPLVHSQYTGFDGSRFAFQHPAYQDYFVKEYLSIRFAEFAENINQEKYSRDQLADAVVTLVTELIVNEVEERATNSLYFLCWDNQSLGGLASALESLFAQPTKMGGEEFSYLLTYALVFVRLYRDLRGLPVDLRSFCFDNDREDDLILLDGQALNRYLTDLRLFLCTFGNIQLRNTTCQNCEFLRISVRSLALDGSIEFNGGTLYLVSDEEGGAEALAEAIYPTGPKVDIHLKSVRVHRETWDALKLLQNRFSNVSVVADDSVEILDFEEERNSVEGSAKRVINQLMRLVRKDRRGEFGVFKHKLFGRTSIPSAKIAAVEDFLYSRKIIERKGNIFIVANENTMYHPDGLYGRTFEAVEEYWSPLISELDELLSS